MKTLFSHVLSQLKDINISEEYRKESMQEIILLNVKSEKILSILLIAVDVVLLCVDAAASAFWTTNDHIFGRFASFHVLLLVVPALFLLLVYIGEKMKISGFWFCKVSHTLLIMVVLTICALIAVSNVRSGILPYAYIVALFCIASLVLLENYEICIIYSSTYFIYVIGAYETQLNFRYQAANLIFMAILVMLASAVSRVRYCTHIRSFTDHKTIMEKSMELKEISAMFKATFDNIPDVIVVKDTNRKVIQANKAALNFFNAPNAELIGVKCYELMGLCSICKDCILSEVINNKQPARMEEYIEWTGTWFDKRVYPILDDSGQITKTIDHIRDISSQKKAEMELQRINSILNAQMEVSIDGIIIIDKNNHILGHNRKFAIMWDIPDSILKVADGERLFRYLLQGTVNGRLFTHWTNEMSRSTFEYDYEKVRLKNGHILEVYSSPILISQEETCGRVWYFRDVTEKEQMIEKLRRVADENEKLLKEAVKYDELKSEFFANISHEFRTPINVLLGVQQLLNVLYADKCDIQLNVKIKKYFGIMKQNCYRLLRLTNNLIDMTRLDTGFFEISLRNHNIVKVVEEIMLSVAAFVENKGIRLIFDTDVEEKIIAVDADKIERILLNLLSNAVKFTNENGTILVNIQDRQDHMEISVKDTGIGIPEEKLDIIFERFRQVNSTLSREYEGSGIGLSLTKNLVELHGGTIRVVSEPGKGSEFTVALPCRTVETETNSLPVLYTNQNRVERINIEFSDIYSIQNNT